MSDSVKVFTNERQKTGGRVKGTPNRLTVDSKALQDYYIEQGYKAINEIAFLTANELYEIMQEVKEEYGDTSREFNTAVANSVKATQIALPYFSSQFKTLVLATTEEDGLEQLNKSVENILAKFGQAKK